MIKRLFFIFLLSGTLNAGHYEDAVKLFDDGQYPQALAKFEPLAKHKHAQAQYYLGGMYLDGLGVTEDPGKAVYWLDQAVNNKHRDAAIMLGKMYLSGLGVPLDAAKGMQYINLSDGLLAEGEELEECD